MDPDAYKIETLDHCPNCRSTEISPWVSSGDVLLQNDRQVFSYSHCGHCNVCFQQTRPTEDTIGFFYRGDYGPYSRKEQRRPPSQQLHKRLLKLSMMLTGEKRERARIKAAYAHHLAGHGRTLLDFGCGGGLLLDDLKAKFGCETIGMDFDKSLVAAAAAQGHRAYLESPEGWAQIPDGSANIVTMNHVLEHLYQPRAILQQIYRVLKPGGALLIAVPNPDGYSARTYKQDWFGLDSPRHIILYPPQAGIKLLEECKFVNVDVIGLAVTKDVLRSKARRDNETSKWPLAADGIETAKIALLVRREAAKGRFDQFVLLAHKG